MKTENSKHADINIQAFQTTTYLTKTVNIAKHTGLENVAFSTNRKKRQSMKKEINSESLKVCQLYLCGLSKFPLCVVDQI